VIVSTKCRHQTANTKKKFVKKKKFLKNQKNRQMIQRNRGSLVIILNEQRSLNLINVLLDDYARVASEVRRYRMLYDKNHPDYMKSKLKQEIWNNVAKSLKTIDGKKIDGTKGKNFFNSGKAKLTTLQKAMKSGSAAISSKKASEFESMMKTFSFLKDHIEPKS
jgi:hypothetical protein